LGRSFGNQMATTFPLPDVSKVQSILGVLFEGLEVKAGGTFDKSFANGAWFGVFIGAGDVPVALCGADLSLAASLSAALSMLPPTAVKEAMAMRDLGGVMRENLREIMNICTRLVLDSTSPHLKLDQVYPYKSLPAAAAAILVAAPGHREFHLQLPRYGGGVLSVLSG
jgi:hypothetical protein